MGEKTDKGLLIDAADQCRKEIEAVIDKHNTAFPNFQVYVKEGELSFYHFCKESPCDFHLHIPFRNNVV